MLIELLAQPPISGTTTERSFDASSGANTWVRFEDNAGGAWVGVFGSAKLANFNAALPFADDDGRTALVIAGGQGYVVDTVSGALIRRTPWDYAYEAVAVPGRDFVLVADTTLIWASNRVSDRPVWRRARAAYDYDDGESADRLALDGIRFDRVTHDELVGKVWEPDGWYAFHVGLPDLEFKRGELLGRDWERFASLEAPVGGPAPAAEHVEAHEQQGADPDAIWRIIGKFVPWLKP